MLKALHKPLSPLSGLAAGHPRSRDLDRFMGWVAEVPVAREGSRGREGFAPPMPLWPIQLFFVARLDQLCSFETQEHRHADVLRSFPSWLVCIIPQGQEGLTGHAQEQ